MALDNSLIRSAAAVQFQSGTDVNRFFQLVTNTHFVDWFNTSCARQEDWGGKSIGAGPAVKDRFKLIWDGVPGLFSGSSVNLLQFLAMMSIFVNEAGGDLVPVTERTGTRDYPGLSYAFNAIPGVKRSYNSRDGNRLAGALFFDDPVFWTAHGNRPSGKLVRSRPELRAEWDGVIYPNHAFSNSLVGEQTGFIQQADFYKFRGRGFIQTTWRSNYRPLVNFIKSYDGPEEKIRRYRDLWSTLDPDQACTASTNDDWDALFGGSNFVVPLRAVGMHNEANGRYLQLSNDPEVLGREGGGAGSLYRVGLRINGSSLYAALFRRRVLQLLAKLNHLG